MKEWKCPTCKRVRFYKKELVMKVCYVCQVEMEVISMEKGVRKNGSKKF